MRRNAAVQPLIYRHPAMPEARTTSAKGGTRFEMRRLDRQEDNHRSKEHEEDHLCSGSSGHTGANHTRGSRCKECCRDGCTIRLLLSAVLRLLSPRLVG